MMHFTSMAILLASVLPGVVAGQNVPDKPTVPTTRILAIGSVTSPITPEERKTIMPREVKATVELYLQGKIDQWWFRADGKGVVFLMNVTTMEEAHTLLEALPLGVAKRMTFELMPLGPLFPLKALLADKASD